MKIQEEFTIENYDYTFRVAKMNAIELLALETQLNFKGLNQSQAAIESILERIEVKIGDKWATVKMKDRQVYTPTEVEEDVNLVAELMTKFTKEIVNPVFQKSEE